MTPLIVFTLFIVLTSGISHEKNNLSELINMEFDEDAGLNFTQLTAKYGYPTETHEVITEDKYILTLFRIRNKKCAAMNPTPVLIWHGLLQTADTWIVPGPKMGLGYLIADKCYDLWLGNSRGNRYSNKHVYLNHSSDNFQYWNFTFDNMGLFDLPAGIDYILQNTKSPQLNYIGYSQGTKQFFILTSSRPEYNRKIRLSICLAPVAYQGHLFSPIVRLLSLFTTCIEKGFALFKTYGLFSRESIMDTVLHLLCHLFPKICAVIGYIFTGLNPDNLSRKTVRIASGHFPSATSIFDLAHYGQAVLSDKFQRYDYGEIENLKIYGTKMPPQYNISKVTANVAIITGSNDWLVSPKDTARLCHELPNIVHKVMINQHQWSHIDFALGKYIPTVLAPIVFKTLEDF